MAAAVGAFDYMESRLGGAMAAQEGLRAFRVVWGGDPGVEAIYGALSASKARYLAYLSLSDVRRGVSIIELQVRRAPEYDMYASEPGAISAVDRYLWDRRGHGL